MEWGGISLAEAAPPAGRKVRLASVHFRPEGGKTPEGNCRLFEPLTDPKTGRKYLDVDVLLASQPDTRYLGRLYQDELSAEAVPHKDEHNENEPVVTAYVKLNLDDFPEEKKIPREQFVTGLEVRTKVRCGDHPLGYSLFHGVWEWFYEKVVFFF